MVALQTCVCSTKHFKHVNRMWKMEILRKSLTATAHHKTKRGRIKDNRCSKGLILLIGAWHLFSAAENLSAFMVDNGAVSRQCPASHLFSRGIHNIHLMFPHSSKPHISLFAQALCHFCTHGIRLLVCLHKTACNVYQAIAEETSTSYVS